MTSPQKYPISANSGNFFEENLRTDPNFTENIPQNGQNGVNFSTEQGDLRERMGQDPRFRHSLLSLMDKAVSAADPENKKKPTHKIALEVLKHLGASKKTHLGPLYMEITHGREFSGHVTDAKIKLLAKKQGKTQRTIRQHLSQLVEMNLLELHQTKNGPLWMAVGADLFASRVGRSAVKFAPIRENPKRSDFTTLYYAAVISEEYKKKAHSAKRKRAESCEPAQDTNDGLKAAQISCSYTQGHLRTIGVKRSIPTISKQRKRAKGLDMLSYKRGFHVKELMDEEGTMTKMAGGMEVAEAFMAHSDNGWLRGGEKLSFRKDAVVWYVEHPAQFSRVLAFQRRGMSSKRKKEAAIRYASLSLR